MYPHITRIRQMAKKALAYQPSARCYQNDTPADPEGDGDDAANSANGDQTVDKIREQLGEYLTRRQGAEFVRDILGRPFSFSTASQLAALGEFAPPALWWGRRPLYTRDDLRQWVEARS
jgi:hypothetical protein